MIDVCDHYGQAGGGVVRIKHGAGRVGVPRHVTWPPRLVHERVVQQSYFVLVAKYWRLYCKYSSLVGLKYFVDDRITCFGKTLWCIAYAVAMIFVSLFILDIYVEYNDLPLSALQKSELYPTGKLTFPGVAVCTVNRISLRSARELAAEMFAANISELSVAEIRREIFKLGDSHRSTFETADNYTRIKKLLTKFFNGSYDISDVMERPSPRCSSMFVHCNFHDKPWNCSDIISVGKTHEGFCCIFNHVDELEDSCDSDSLDGRAGSRLHTVEGIGLRYGLSVVMDPLLDDYFYPTHPTLGWKVMVFNPYDYPDSSSGSVWDILLSPLSEKFVHVTAMGRYIADNLRSYPVQQRGCVFRDEGSSNGVSYTQNGCITGCKLAHIRDKCRCSPFYYPRPGSTKGSSRTCGVDDVRCLREYYGKSYDVIPYDDSIAMSLIQDRDTAVVCKDCYPECESVTYGARSSTTNLHAGSPIIDLPVSINVTDHAILHVYFSDISTVFLKREENYGWYDRLSDAGGLYGLFVGFSIISLVEMIYFVLLFTREAFTPPEPAPDEIPRNDLTRFVYWNEFSSYFRTHE